MTDKLSNEFKKNVYLKPDEYLNGWARKCGWKATLVYDSLWRHADKDRRCFPSIELMAEEHGISRDSIIRGLKTLIDYHLVVKKENRDKNGKFLHNTYTLTDKTKWRDVSKSLTATRSAKSPTAFSRVAHSDYKDTHNKDTHILVSKDTNRRQAAKNRETLKQSTKTLTKPRGDKRNSRVSLVLDSFIKRWGQPVDPQPRRSAWNLVQRIEKNMVARNFDRGDDTRFKKVLDGLLYWLSIKDWSDELTKISTVNRHSRRFFDL